MNNIEKQMKESGRKVRLQKILTFKGKTSEYETFQFELESLKYNTQNGRIASNKFDRKGQYNKKTHEIIKNAIIDSNTKEFEKLKNDIRKKGHQTEPGVITKDGIIIDGNQRFTALQSLYLEEIKNGNNQDADRYKYFKAAVVEGSIDSEDVKLLEISIQHGEVGKTDYSSVNMFMDVYETMTKYKKTPEYLAEFYNVKTSSIKTYIKKAKIAMKMTQLINGDDDYKVLEDLKLDPAIVELANVSKENQNDPIFNNLLWFSYIAAISIDRGDLKQTVRNLKNTKAKNIFIEDSVERERFKELTDEIINDDSIDLSEDASADTKRAIVASVREITKMSQEMKINANVIQKGEDLKSAITKIMKATDNQFSLAFEKISLDTIRDFVGRINEVIIKPKK